jgi:hypothetical protein
VNIKGFFFIKKNNISEIFQEHTILADIQVRFRGRIIIYSGKKLKVFNLALPFFKEAAK